MIYEGEPHLSHKSPELPYNTFELEVSYINTILGLNMNIDQIQECCQKMGLAIKETKGSTIVIEVPPQRSDILHACDIAEDIGIAYGYNNIPKVFPPTNTIGK